MQDKKSGNQFKITRARTAYSLRASGGREDEILRLAREAAGDEETFMTGLLALARRDVQEVLDEIRALDEPGSRTVSYEELARLGRRLAAAAALIAGEEAT